MKTILNKTGLGGLALGLILLFSSGLNAKAENHAYSGVSFQVFYDALTPFGDWVKDARYGYIWLPAVYDDFHPYGTNGHWVMTEYGNTWVSDYDWGWATFHYGRWYFDDYYQSWAWIPGYEWAPAWVSWRSGGGYYGWAPLGPGVSINVRINIPTRHWVFIPTARIYHQNVWGFYSPYAHHRTKIKIINRTTVVNNTVVYNNYSVYAGPSRREVERVTRQAVPVYNIRSSEAPGRAAVARNEVRLYRPEINESRGRTAEARPSRVMDANEVRSARSSRQVGPATSSGSSTNRGAYENPSPRREASPSGRGNQGSFDLKQAPAETRTRGTSGPSTRSTAPSRQETRPAPSRESQVRSSSPSSNREAVNPRNSAPARSSDVRQPQQRTQSAPNVRSAPSRPTETRTSAPTRSQGRTEVKSSSPARSSSSAPARTQSSSSGRGKSREKNN
ncbi:DUF6600 domain-containing protein [Algoriphagus sanaruensis]|uniref:Prolin-rich transmembrane protein n=1 Tax=Algoriphagus sanaruensis TaxID=1727163 RepID=A0A142EM61_9BACT|nr:DUF6600 domain-containing protein [Algoriphagus sanaruensis]AMQ56216.1 hypothetical protein AO498_07300 [Algoriphagus sanaruensis]